MKTGDGSPSSFLADRTCHGFLVFIYLSDAVVFDDIVHVLITAAGEVDEDGAVVHGLGKLHGVGNGVGTFDGGDYALEASQLIESINGLLVVHNVILNSAKLMEEGVLRAGGGIVQTAGYGVNGSGLAVFILEHDGIKAMHNALGAILQAGCMVAKLGTAAKRLNAIDIDGVIEEAGEHTGGVGAAANAGNNGIGQLTGHGGELVAGFNANDGLEVSYHQGEGMGAQNGAYAVDGVLIVLGIGIESGVNCFLEGLEAFFDLDNICAQNLHSGNVGSLLFDINSAHINIALQTEISGGGGKGNTVLTGAGFGDYALFAHIFGKEGFAHAVVELMSAGVVEVLALGIKLNIAEGVAESFKMGDGGGSALKFLADAAKLGDKLSGFADGEICLGYLVHSLLQLGVYERAAILAEEAVLIGIVFQIGFKINALIYHGNILLCFSLF